MTTNPLPHLLQTPGGLALLELQGTIKFDISPTTHTTHTIDDPTTGPNSDGDGEDVIPIGRLVFPEYTGGPSDTSKGWMKRVYLYVGAHQRLAGEVKMLPRAVAV
jgi:chromosome transmission fidelity protein 8